MPYVFGKPQPQQKPRHKQHTRPAQPALTVYCRDNRNEYIWTIDSQLLGKSAGFAAVYNDVHYSYQLLIDPAFIPGEVARMIVWFRTGAYPLRSIEAIRPGSHHTLNKFMQDAAVHPGQKNNKDDANELSDPGKVHLRMLKLATTYQIPDLIRHCLDRIGNYMQRHPKFVWMVRDYRGRHELSGKDELKKMERKGLVEHAREFVTKERFERMVKNDSDLAWEIIRKMTRRTKQGR